MEVNWLETCKRAGEKVRKEVMEQYCSEKGREIVGRGAGGDRTMRVDQNAENIVLRELGRLDTPLLVITEEKGEVKLGKGEPEKTVVIDPLDGSNNARMGVPVFALSIAVLKSRGLDSLEFGFIEHLGTGHQYHAHKGKGAYKNREKINCSRKEELDYVLLSKVPSAMISHEKLVMKLLSEANHVRAYGSSAVNACLLAEGQAQIMIRIPEGRALDIVAGKLIVEEAGGIVTDLQGKELEEEVRIDCNCSLMGFANPIIKQKILNQKP